MTIRNLKDLGQIYAGTRREYSTPLYNPNILEGRPFIAIEAYNSTTGRHGSGKTNLLYQLLLTGTRSNKSFDTDTRILPWTESPSYEERQAIVLRGRPSLLVKDLETLEEIEAQVLRGSALPQQGSQITIQLWKTPEKVYYLYLR